MNSEFKIRLNEIYHTATQEVLELKAKLLFNWYDLQREKEKHLYYFLAGAGLSIVITITLIWIKR